MIARSAPAFLARTASAGLSVNVEVNIAKEQHPRDAGLEAIGTPSAYACPECHGVLLQLVDEERVRFRCHTGHA